MPLRRRSAPALLLTLLTTAAAAPEGRAQTPLPPGEAEGNAQYRACMTLARTQPVDAFESALAWLDSGGGHPARHCVAIALIGLRQFGPAAERLEALAGEVEPRLRADLLVQAGQSWSMAGDLDRAYAAQSAALELRPDDVELLIDRSITLAGANHFWEAIDDLNRAQELAPERPEILVYRASAYRFLDAPQLALADVEAALLVMPDHPEGLLERGMLRRMLDDPAGARADWLAVLRLAPGTPAASLAQRNLEKLDVTVE